MKPLVIFGAGILARLAAWYFRTEYQYEIAAFCVDDSFCEAQIFDSAPLLPASNIVNEWPPDVCDIFIALGYQDQNRIRQSQVEKYASLGYNIVSCVSSKAIIQNDGHMGRNCFIMEGAVLQPYSRLGDNCICWSNSVVAHESTLEDNCFLAAGSVVGGLASIGRNTFLGINAVVRDAVRIGEFCVIGAGCIVLDNLEDDTLVATPGSKISKIPASKALRYIQI